MNLIKRITNRLKLFVLIGVQPIIRCWENRYFEIGKDVEHQPVFIIGAPRTGSTILYQALTNCYQFAYIDNITCTWHRNLRFGLWLSSKKYGDEPHNNFKAEHGNTEKLGGHAPSECGQFWYRWLPKDRHFIDYDDITEKIVAEIRTEVLDASNYLKKPILFKNLNAGQRLRLISKAFPEAKIIYVKRDPRFVVRSIVKAREKVSIKPGQWWSIMPPNVKELLKLPESEMCAAQVYYLEKQIEKDLHLFPDQNVKKIHYQNFSQQLLGELGRWCGVPQRADSETPTFRQDKLNSLKSSERENLDKIIAKYDFEEESFA